jgi:predicted phosphodiesterase
MTPALTHIAILSDIHGNLTALEAVLNDCRARGVSRIYNLGDLVGKGPDGAAVIDLCQRACHVNLFGNWDDLILRQETQSKTVRWNQAQLGPQRMAWLRELPTSANLLLSGRRIRLFHASEQGIWHRHYTTDKPLSMFKNTDFTGYQHPAPDVVGYGDIHTAFILPLFRPKNKTLFNAGSVGNSLDEPRATYVILSGVLDSENRHDPFSLQIIRLSYDVDAVLARARMLKMPKIKELEIELRQSIYRDNQL